MTETVQPIIDRRSDEWDAGAALFVAISGMQYVRVRNQWSQYVGHGYIAYVCDGYIAYACHGYI